MSADLGTDLGIFNPMVDKGHVMGNLFSSNPGYDEAVGPPDGDDFVPIQNFSEEEGVGTRGFNGCGEEDEEAYWDRLMRQDADEPLGPGETLDMVRDDVMYGYARITADPSAYYPRPTRKAARLFAEAEMHPARAGVVTTRVRKFCLAAEKNAGGRWKTVQVSVKVEVRKHRVYH